MTVSNAASECRGVVIERPPGEHSKILGSASNWTHGHRQRLPWRTALPACIAGALTGHASAMVRSRVRYSRARLLDALALGQRPKLGFDVEVALEAVQQRVAIVEHRGREPRHRPPSRARKGPSSALAPASQPTTSRHVRMASALPDGGGHGRTFGRSASRAASRRRRSRRSHRRSRFSATSASTWTTKRSNPGKVGSSSNLVCPRVAKSRHQRSTPPHPVPSFGRVGSGWSCVSTNGRGSSALSAASMTMASVGPSATQSHTEFRHWAPLRGCPSPTGARADSPRSAPAAPGESVMRRTVVCPSLLRSTAKRRTSSSSRSSPSSTVGLCAVKSSCRSGLAACSHVARRPDEPRDQPRIQRRVEVVDREDGGRGRRQAEDGSKQNVECALARVGGRRACCVTAP